LAQAEQKDASQPGGRNEADDNCALWNSAVSRQGEIMFEWVEEEGRNGIRDDGDLMDK
jgi:hypothetical protein